MRNKIFIVLILFTLAILGACTESEPNDEEHEEEAEDTVDSELAELLSKMKKEAGAIDSYSLDKRETEELTFVEDEKSWKSSFSSTIFVTFDPVSYRQMDLVLIPGLIYEDHEDAEIVFTGDEYYSYNEEEEVWEKYPEASFAHMPKQIIQQFAMKSVIKAIEKIAYDMDFIEEEDHYLLQMIYDEESMTEEDDLKDVLAMIDPQQLKDLDVNYLMYEITIDKETYYIDQMKTTMNFTVEAQDREVEVERQTEVAYERYNDVSPVNASSISMPEIVEVEP